MGIWVKVPPSFDVICGVPTKTMQIRTDFKIRTHAFRDVEETEFLIQDHRAQVRISEQDWSQGVYILVELILNAYTQITSIDIFLTSHTYFHKLIRRFMRLARRYPKQLTITERDLLLFLSKGA